PHGIGTRYHASPNYTHLLTPPSPRFRTRTERYCPVKRLTTIKHRLPLVRRQRLGQHRPAQWTQLGQRFKIDLQRSRVRVPKGSGNPPSKVNPSSDAQ